MPESLYYLHFQKSPSTAIVELLSQYCSTIDPVFENSFDVTSDLSFPSFKHLLTENIPTENFYLAKIKRSTLRILNDSAVSSTDGV